MEVRFLDDNACAKVVQALAITRLNYANSLLTDLPQSALTSSVLPRTQQLVLSADPLAVPTLLRCQGN